MVMDLQKANLWKRVSAALFDFIMLCIVAVGAAAVLSGVLGYDGYANTYDSKCEYYGQKYGIELPMPETEVQKLPQAEQDIYTAARKEFLSDSAALKAERMLINLPLLLVTFGILIGILLMDVLVPALFGNGQSLGKKIFGVALMRIDGMKLTGVQLFVRSVLGKFAVELMIPIYVIWMIFSGTGGIFGLALLLFLLIAQILCLVKTRTGSLLHDVMAVTVAVDMASQMIFETKEEQLKYIKERHAKKAANSTY